VTNATTVRSVNGPLVTIIQGYQLAGTSASTNAVRGAYLGGGAFLSGFTITNGEAGTGNYVNGGGIAGARSSAVISNCVLTGNVCAGAGGGADSVTLINCVLAHNQAGGGGAASQSTLVNCMITNNSAGWAAGMLGCKATNCMIAYNSATSYGGGSGFSTLVNCTVAANSLQSGYGGNGGGSYNDTLLNCIVYYNTAPNGSNYYSSGMTFSCAAPLANGVGNITNDPVFVNLSSGNFRLQTNSPCINSGNNAYVSANNDLDGNPRIVGGTVDIGAYEYQTPSSVLSYAWAQQYGLPTDGTVDYADTDGDGMSNYAEWKAGTNPTNAASVLALQSPATTNTTGISVTWQSVGGVTYYLLSSTNLPVFTSIQSNLVGQAGTTSYTDTTATNGGPYFYRVGVQ
jgi:hypothetical protein